MLTYTSDDGAVSFSVAFDRYDGDRIQYRWTVRVIDPQGHVAPIGEWSADDLRSASGDEYDLCAMLRTFSSFLGAWCESHATYGNGARGPRGHSGENADLFPREMVDAVDIGTWSHYVDEMSMALDTFASH